jgi:hypothetical protein
MERNFKRKSEYPTQIERQNGAVLHKTAELETSGAQHFLDMFRRFPFVW